MQPHRVTSSAQYTSTSPRRTILFACLAAPFAMAAGNANLHAAQRFVAQQRVGSGLAAMAMTTASRTQTFAMLSSKLGAAEARASVSRELNGLLPGYQAAWDQNLAAAYAKHFTEEELTSLASEGRSSKHAPKVAERQSAVGADARVLSEPVLTDLVKKALANAFAKLPR